MHIELRDETAQALVQRAETSGMSVDALVENLLNLREDAGSEPGRREAYSVREWRENLQQSGARLGRNGRPWREFIHEGHKY